MGLEHPEEEKILHSWRNLQKTRTGVRARGPQQGDGCTGGQKQVSSWGGLVKRSTYNWAGNNLSKHQVGESDDMARNETVPVTSFLRTNFATLYAFFQYSCNF